MCFHWYIQFIFIIIIFFDYFFFFFFFLVSEIVVFFTEYSSFSRLKRYILLKLISHSSYFYLSVSHSYEFALFTVDFNHWAEKKIYKWKNFVQIIHFYLFCCCYYYYYRYSSRQLFSWVQTKAAVHVLVWCCYVHASVYAKL